MKLKRDVKAGRTKPTFIADGGLKDSANMGTIEGPIRHWQAKVRTIRFATEKL